MKLLFDTNVLIPLEPGTLEDIEPGSETSATLFRTITGCDPVPPSHRGDLDAMASDWLAWARIRAKQPMKLPI